VGAERVRDPEAVAVRFHVVAAFGVSLHAQVADEGLDVGGFVRW
jgi:hypothetical protein